MFEVLKLLISPTHLNNLVGQNNCDIYNLMKPLIVNSGFVSIFILLLFPGTVLGYDITDKFSIGGVLAGAYQYQWVDGDDNKGRGALPFQPEFSFRPTEKDEIFTKFGFAAGNGLNGVTKFNLQPWAADLEDDLKDINGRNRDYLLTVWYKHTFEFRANSTLELTGGIIDATDYVVENAYASDEYTQFMNQALVNASFNFAPSYDFGGAVEWGIGSWNITGVGMNVGENADGYNFNYFAVTTDLQYMNDKYKTANLEDVDGIIGGIRFTFKF